MKTKCPKCGGTLAADGLCAKCLVAMAEHPTGEPVEELPLTPGQPFRGLEVLELVGRGGMGVVYKARQPHLDRFVALKVLPRKLAADPEFRERFGREARALAGLAHPHIVGVYDFGFEEDLPFLVLEFVDGANLREILRSRKLKPEEAIAIVPQLCDALQYAHAEGVVHRDVKPENILLDKKGRVKIADFGLAKIVGGAMTRLDTITKSNVAMGTPHYMAPEQFEHPKEVDHRADIYSMGVVFYEMLTGELPIGKFEPPSRKVEVDVRLDDVVLKTLEKAPERRYQQVSEVKEAVTRITERPAERAPRGAGVWKAVAVVAVVAAVAIGVVHFAPRKRTPVPENPRIAELRKRLDDIKQDLDRLCERYNAKAPHVARKLDEYNRLEGELAKLEGRAPRPYEVPKAAELKLESVILSAKDLPSGFAWADASQDIVESDKAIVSEEGDPLWELPANRDYSFRLRNVRVHALECADDVWTRQAAAACTIKLRTGTSEVIDKDRIVVAIWFEGDPAVESTRLYDAIVDRMREKMGLASENRHSGATFGPSPDYFRNRRGGSSTLQDLVFDPKRPRLYVSDHGTGSVLVFSTDELRLVGEIPVGKQPHGMDISPDGRLAVAVAGDRHVAIIDLEKMAVVKKIEGREVPYSVRFSRSKDALAVAYVDDPGTGEVEPTCLKAWGTVDITEPLTGGYPLLLLDEPTGLLVSIGRGGDESEFMVTPFEGRASSNVVWPRWNGPPVTDAAVPRSMELLVAQWNRPEITQIGFGQGTLKRVGTVNLPKGPAIAMTLGPGGLFCVAVAANEVAILDDKGRVARSFTFGAAEDPAPGLFASSDGKWLYILSGDRLLRAAIPFVEKPRIESVRFLGQAFAERIRNLFARMMKIPDDPCARELVSLGRRAFDCLAEGIENERDDGTVEKLLFLLTLAKEPAYAEKMLGLAGKRGRDVDGWIARYLTLPGALKDAAMRARFSERFCGTHPGEVFDVNFRAAQDEGFKEGVETALAVLPTCPDIPGIPRHFRYRRLCDLLGIEGEEDHRMTDLEKAAAKLAGWWTENRDRLKWNAEKRVFEKAP